MDINLFSSMRRYNILFSFFVNIFIVIRYKIFITIYHIKLQYCSLLFTFFENSSLSDYLFSNLISRLISREFSHVSLSSWQSRYFLLLNRERAMKERPHLRGEKMTKIRVMALVVIRCGDIFGVHTFIEKSLNGRTACGRTRGHVTYMRVCP